ncbi:MAG: tail fiber domain-containing protein [Candidatus Vogelbacteria bacterium]|nr:tail fiber domain-containing protein [Candidatus Vogelbacteria bacterium]
MPPPPPSSLLLLLPPISLLPTSPYANGGTNATSFGTNLLTYFDGTRLTSTSSPTVGYVVATSSRASILPYASTTALTISGTGYFAGSGIWNSAGSVGVGTTSPSVKLEVVTGTSGTENRFLVDPATTNGSNRTLRFSRLGDGWGIQSEYTNTGAVRDLSLQASGGNVGIGTSTPGVALDIVGSFGTKPTAISGTLLALSNTLSTANNTYASLISGNAAEAGIYLGDQNDVDIGGIIYNHTNNYLGFRTNNTADRLIIDSSGKVGINKSAPATTLDVVGTASSTGLQVNGTGNIQGSGDANRLTIDSASGSSVLNIINSGHGEHSAIQFTRERSTGPGIASGFIRSPSNTANNFGKLELGAFTSGTYATASSSVGSLFRLNSDASALSGGAYAELFRASTADLTENWLSFNMLNSATTETTYSQLRTILTASTTGDGSLAFLTRKANTLTEAMRIDHNSRLGVGTSTPNWLLQVAGTRPSFALSDTAGGTNLKHWLLSSQGGNLYIATSSDALATSTTAALTVSANGYLGIGSTTPAYALSVTGGLFATASSTMMNGINLTGGCFAISGTCLVGGGSGTVNSGTINGLAYYTGSTAVSSAGTNLFWDNTNTRLMLGHINRGINNLTASTTYIGQGYDGTGAGDAGGNTYISNGGDATGAGNSDGGAGGIITMVAGGLKTGSGSDGNDGIVNIGNSAGSRNAILSVYGTATTTDDLWVLGGDINLALTTASALTTNLSNGKDVAGAAGLAGTVNLAIGGEGTGASGDGGAGGTVNIANGGIGDGDDGGNAGTVYLAVGGEGDTDAGNVGGDGGTVLMVTGGTGNTNGTAGKVGIATSTPWRTLSVTGSVGFDGLTTNTGAAAASLCLSSANEVTKNTDNETCLASSLRYKNNVTDLATDTDLLDQLRTVSFNYKNESDPLTHYGLIAEEVAAIDTRLVSYDDEGLANGIRWSHLTTLLIKRTQEQEQRLDELSSLISGGDMLARLWTLDETTGNIKAFAVLDLNNFELRNVKAITSASGKWSIDDNGKLITEDIETKRLLVEEGVTTRDKASGDYYCIYVENGVVKTAAGRCEDLEEEDNGNNDDSEPEPEEPEEEPELPPTLEPDAPVDTPPTEEVPNPEPEPEPEPEPDQEPQSTPLVEDSPPDPIPANNEDSPQNPIPEESPQSPEPEPTS